VVELAAGPISFGSKGARRMQEAIGWASSVILVLTISKQIYKQWKEGSSESVSKWLFVGQLAASVGFLVYSWLVRNWVFVATNGLMVVNAVLGLLIVLHHRRSEARGQDGGGKGNEQPASGSLNAERA